MGITLFWLDKGKNEFNNIIKWLWELKQAIKT